MYNGTNQITITPTRFATLGFANTCPQGKPLWRFVDLSEPGQQAVVGPQYRTRAELLADLEDYATRAMA